VLGDIDVELLNDYYQTIARTKTDGSGRYSFEGLRNGRHSVRVFAFRYDYEDQTQEYDINTQSLRGGEGVGFFVLDFYLIPRKGGLAAAEIGTIFAQEIPPSAKKLYDRAMSEFSKKKPDEALMTLDEAIKIFPDYFEALQKIGRELYAKKRYEDSIPFFFKAAEVNPKSATSFYFLGAALFHLDDSYHKASLTSLNQAYNLAPASIQILWYLGKVERTMGKYENAEKHLLQAKKLSVNNVPEIHKELAQLYSDNLKKYKEAAEELELYLKHSKSSDADSKKIKEIIAGLKQKAKQQTISN